MQRINLYDLIFTLDPDTIISLTFVCNNRFVQRQFLVSEFFGENEMLDIIDQVKTIRVNNLYTAVCYDHDKNEYYSCLYIGCNKVFLMNNLED